jgi:hypothetical protein
MARFLWRRFIFLDPISLGQTDNLRMAVPAPSKRSPKKGAEEAEEFNIIIA